MESKAKIVTQKGGHPPDGSLAGFTHSTLSNSKTQHVAGV